MASEGAGIFAFGCESGSDGARWLFRVCFVKI